MEESPHDIIMLEQFYKPEENSVLFSIYQILCQQADTSNKLG